MSNKRRFWPSRRTWGWIMIAPVVIFVIALLIGIVVAMVSKAPIFLLAILLIISFAIGVSILCENGPGW